jgi:hypothetical protein
MYFYILIFFNKYISMNNNSPFIVEKEVIKQNIFNEHYKNLYNLLSEFYFEFKILVNNYSNNSEKDHKKLLNLIKKYLILNTSENKLINIFSYIDELDEIKNNFILNNNVSNSTIEIMNHQEFKYKDDINQYETIIKGINKNIMNLKKFMKENKNFISNFDKIEYRNLEKIHQSIMIKIMNIVSLLHDYLHIEINNNRHKFYDDIFNIYDNNKSLIDFLYELIMNEKIKVNRGTLFDSFYEEYKELSNKIELFTKEELNKKVFSHDLSFNPTKEYENKNNQYYIPIHENDSFENSDINNHIYHILCKININFNTIISFLTKMNKVSFYPPYKYDEKGFFVEEIRSYTTDDHLKFFQKLELIQKNIKDKIEMIKNKISVEVIEKPKRKFQIELINYSNQYKEIICKHESMLYHKSSENNNNDDDDVNSNNDHINTNNDDVNSNQVNSNKILSFINKIKDLIK